MKRIISALLATGAVMVTRSVYSLPTQLRNYHATLSMQRFRSGKQRERVALVTHAR
jgi:hypothetical protein